MANPPHEIRTDPEPSKEGGRTAESGSDSILSVDEIMLRINREVISRGGKLPAAMPSVATTTPFRLANWQPSAPRIPVKQEYVLAELLSFSDMDFVENAYRAVLRRTPDEVGLAHHLSRLRNGQASKVEILAALRWSCRGREGRGPCGRIAGSLPAAEMASQAIHRPGDRMVQSLVRLSSLSDRQIVLDAAHAREDHELGRILNLQAQQFEKTLSKSIPHTPSGHRPQWLSWRLFPCAAGRGGFATRGTWIASMRAHTPLTGESMSCRLEGWLECRMQAALIPALLAGADGARAHSHAVADQVGTLSTRMDGLAGVDAHSHAVADQVGVLSARPTRWCPCAFPCRRGPGRHVVDAHGWTCGRGTRHSHAVADQVGTLSSRLDELAGVSAHSLEVADQVARCRPPDALADLHDQAQVLVHRVNTVSARPDAQPDVVPVVRLISERIEDMSSQLQASRLSPPARRKDQVGGRRGK